MTHARTGIDIPIMTGQEGEVYTASFAHGGPFWFLRKSLQNPGQMGVYGIHMKGHPQQSLSIGVFLNKNTINWEQWKKGASKDNEAYLGPLTSAHLDKLIQSLNSGNINFQKKYITKNGDQLTAHITFQNNTYTLRFNAVEGKKFLDWYKSNFGIYPLGQQNQTGWAFVLNEKEMFDLDNPAAKVKTQHPADEKTRFTSRVVELDDDEHEYNPEYFSLPPEVVISTTDEKPISPRNVLNLDSPLHNKNECVVVRKNFSEENAIKDLKESNKRVLLQETDGTQIIMFLKDPLLGIDKIECNNLQELIQRLNIEGILREELYMPKDYQQAKISSLTHAALRLPMQVNIEQQQLILKFLCEFLNPLKKDNAWGFEPHQDSHNVTFFGLPDEIHPLDMLSYNRLKELNNLLDELKISDAETISVSDKTLCALTALLKKQFSDEAMLGQFEATLRHSFQVKNLLQRFFIDTKKNNALLQILYKVALKQYHPADYAVLLLDEYRKSDRTISKPLLEAYKIIPTLNPENLEPPVCQKLGSALLDLIHDADKTPFSEIIASQNYNDILLKAHDFLFHSGLSNDPLLISHFIKTYSDENSLAEDECLMHECFSHAQDLSKLFKEYKPWKLLTSYIRDLSSDAKADDKFVAELIKQKIVCETTVDDKVRDERIEKLRELLKKHIPAKSNGIFQTQLENLVENLKQLPHISIRPALSS